MNIKLFCDPIFDQTIISETISDLHEPYNGSLDILILAN